MADDHPLVRLETLALIAIGGFAGANLRFFAVGLFPDVLAVLLVNVLGSFALGFLVYEAQYAGLVDRTSRIVFTTGFLSSLTTYSTFAIQTGITAGPAEPLVLVAIVVGNYGLGFAGVLASRALARRVTDGSTTTAETGGETA
ncbi:CrcB family protein [Natrialba sp. INN-245]|uniref:fluoride efflux transporter FluC n=1 Tax=Natrialba sp. INN-245 TaxID=2690967 RepID=UPI0013100FB1|nr:CrcB family protein [Natrialba sp. INN-245]MWV38789.1 chromosome condensation protein CrcB [Natrialba sp. INN-245]